MTSLGDLCGFVGVGCCGLFAGAALYVNVVEHPARMSCGVEIALREWGPSYQRAAAMQASLALLGGIASVLAWALLEKSGYLAGAVLLLAVVPYTLLAVYPTNKRLHALHSTGQMDDAARLLARWNTLHAVRTGLSLAAFCFMLFAAHR